MSATASISAVVVTYGGGFTEVEACVASLRAQTLAPAEIILSDNSPDGRFADHFAAADPALAIVRNNGNTGFTGGTWSGAERATAELLFFINPDARAAPDCLELLARSLADDPGAVIAGAQILLPDGTVNGGDEPVHFSGISWCGNHGGAAAGGPAHRVFTVCGCGYLVPADVFRRFGGFRSRFEMYYDDTDLCWRALIAGLHTVFVPEAIVEHDYEEKGLHVWHWTERNRLLMILTNLEARSLALLAPGIAFTELSSWALALTRGWWRHKLRAYREVLSDPRWLWRERRAIAGYRRIPDTEIVPLLAFELQTPGKPLPGYVAVVNRWFVRYRGWVLRRIGAAA